MIACSVPDSDAAVTLLLQKGADANITNNAGQTALHFCASKNNLDVARILIKEYKASARVRDRRGQLPLHRAAAIGSVPMLRLLLESRSPVNAGDVDGLTGLHHAISEGHGDAAIFLLSQGAEWEKKDGEGRLAIELAPDAKVRGYVLQSAEREGIEIPE
jgi:26S proteasome non-ATPase regulatory subunit 10